MDEINSALNNFSDKLDRLKEEIREISAWDDFANDLIKISNDLRSNSESWYINQINGLNAIIQVLNIINDDTDVKLEEVLESMRAHKDLFIKVQVAFIFAKEQLLNLPTYTENFKQSKVSFSKSIDLLYQRLDEIIDYTWQIEKVSYQTIIRKQLKTDLKPLR